jgi:hypothetical protein
MNTRSLWLSALIAGAVIGFLGNLPLLNLVNCLLCIWAWAGGALAVLLYRRFDPTGPGLTAGQGAGLGALSGLFGALVGAVVFMITSPLLLPLMNNLSRALQIGDDTLFRSGGIGEILVTGLIFLAFNLVFYPLFGALGAAITASLANRPRPA